MLRAVAALVVVLAAPASSAAPAADARGPRPRFRPGAVDLPAGVVRCEGRAAPRLHEESANVTVTWIRTQRAARRDAVRACLAALRGAPLREATVADRLDRDPQLAREVEQVLRSTRPADAPRLFADGGVSLVLAVPLDGALSRLLAGSDTWPPPVPKGAAP